MSADNAVIILVSPVEDFYGKKNGEEARVIECTCPDNLNYDDGTLVDGFNPEQLVNYFGEATPMRIEDAEKQAVEIEQRIALDDCCPILEYGIMRFDLSKPFAYYRDIVRNPITWSEKDENCSHIR